MNPRMVEFALSKQRLQIRAEAERADMMHRLAGVESTLDTIDRLREHLHWAREQAPRVSLLLVAVLLIRPRASLRLAKRAWFAWMLLRRGGRGLPRWVAPLAAPMLRRALARLRRALERSATSG